MMRKRDVITVCILVSLVAYLPWLVIVCTVRQQ
jgi:hypothetical protein